MSRRELVGSIWAPVSPLGPRRHSYPEVDPEPIGLIEEYFEVDKHRRVQVTLPMVERRFFELETGVGVQLPKFAPDASWQHCQLIVVGFKAGRLDVFYVANDLWGLALRVRDLVIVEADRGCDLGRVSKVGILIDEARVLKLMQFYEQQLALGEEVKELLPPALHNPKQVLLLATQLEILGILLKARDEEQACRLCLGKINAAVAKVLASHELRQMKLIDAEYQFDRKKLIFYYSTRKRIDFRELVRELFRFYKTRIWMLAVVGIPFDPLAGLMVPPPKVRSNHYYVHLPVELQQGFFLPVLGGFEGESENDSDFLGEGLVLKSLVDSINH